MKKILLSLVALATIFVASAEGRIEEFRVKSAVLGVEKPCTVYLPEGYDTSGKQYPVLYLLHGASGCHTDWAQKGSIRRTLDEAIGEGVALPMIVVMPDASGEGENQMGAHMGYFDVPGWSYERFFFEEFIPTVEKAYRIVGDKKHRAIAGLSMGGGGSVVYAMHHPDYFSSACPLSGLLDAIPNEHVYGDVFMQSIADTSPVRALEKSTPEQVAAWRTVRWWSDCGDDDFLYESNIRFYELMRRREIPLQFRMRDGSHTWRYWQQGLPAVLTFVSVGFAE